MSNRAASRPRCSCAEPDELGGGIVDLVTLDRVVWAELPEREEAGSPSVMGTVALPPQPCGCTKLAWLAWLRTSRSCRA